MGRHTIYIVLIFVKYLELYITLFVNCINITSSFFKMRGTHQISERGLFNDPYPMQLEGRESLCQVAELIFVDTVRDLIDSDKKSNVNSTE